MTASTSLPHVVIGAGFGGLASAIRLRARGHRVILLEANDWLGGRARVFARDGFLYDAGPTVITAPYLFDELFELVGRDPTDYYEMLPVDPFYRVKFPDGSAFDYVGEEGRILAQIEAMSPGDVDGYRKLADMSRRIFEVGYEQLVDVPFSRLSDMLRITPAMMKLRSYLSVHGMVAGYIRDPRLRQVFTFQPLLIGGNPFHSPSIYLLVHWLERKWGVRFPRGGTGALVRAMADLLDELGVEVRTNSPVSEVEVEGGRAVAVRTEAGERIPCAAVVCNGDPSTLYPKLVAARHRKVNTDRRVDRMRQSMSLFVGYFGADGQWPDTAHHTILMGPRYKELLHDIFERKVLADDFSLYLHRPGATDPGMFPEGKDGFYVLSPVPNQKSGIDWDETAQPYFDKILDFLDQGELPGLRDKLVHSFAVDPRYFQGPLRSHLGAAFGPEPRLLQSAWFRYHNESPDVHGLYLVGAGTHPGAGLPGVLSSAKVLDRLIPQASEPLPIPSARRRAS